MRISDWSSDVCSSDLRLVALRRQNARAEQARPIAENVALTNLRFRYEISGDDPPWRPVRAWDDGSKVYIEFPARLDQGEARSEEHTSELQSLMRISYAVFCLKKKKKKQYPTHNATLSETKNMRRYTNVIPIQTYLTTT